MPCCVPVLRLCDLLKSFDKRATAASAETIEARRAAQNAYSETARAKAELSAHIHAFNGRLVAAQSAYARWHHEQMAAAAAHTAAKHAAEMKAKDKQTQQLQGQVSKLTERCEKEAAKSKKRKCDDDPLGEFFADVEAGRKNLKDRLAVESEKQRRVAKDWKEGGRPTFEHF